MEQSKAHTAHRLISETRCLEKLLNLLKEEDSYITVVAKESKDSLAIPQTDPDNFAYKDALIGVVQSKIKKLNEELEEL